MYKRNELGGRLSRRSDVLLEHPSLLSFLPFLNPFSTQGSQQQQQQQQQQQRVDPFRLLKTLRLNA